jgi:hypothetical protein
VLVGILHANFARRGCRGLALGNLLFTFCQRPTHRRRQLQTDKSSVSCSHLSIKRLGPGGAQIEQWHICVKFWARFILKLRRSRPTPGRALPRPTRRSRLEGFESDALDRSQLHQSALDIGLFLSLSVHPCPALVHHRLYPQSKSLQEPKTHRRLLGWDPRPCGVNLGLTTPLPNLYVDSN